MLDINKLHLVANASQMKGQLLLPQSCTASATPRTLSWTYFCFEAYESMLWSLWVKHISSKISDQALHWWAQDNFLLKSPFGSRKQFEELASFLDAPWASFGGLGPILLGDGDNNPIVVGSKHSLVTWLAHKLLLLHCDRSNINNQALLGL